MTAMQIVANVSRPALSAALETWKNILADREFSTDLVWIFQENLCIERSKAAEGGYHFGFQTKFSVIPEDALEIAYDQFCQTDSRIVFYRLGSCPGRSVCMLLCDQWFDHQGESDGLIRYDDWGISFHPGQDDDIEEVADLTRWLRRVRHPRSFHALDFCMSLETIDEITIYGRPLMPYERFTSRLIARLRKLLNPE